MRLSLAALLATLLATLLALSVPVAPAGAQTAGKAVPNSKADLAYSFAPVVRKAIPAVVNVYASRVEKVPRNPLFDDPVFRRFFGDPGHAGSRTQQSLGSGVIVDPGGLVVTNNHVIEGMTEVKVALSDRRELEAEIVLRDTRTDLAVLRLKGAHDLPVLEFADSDALEVGDIVLAIGNPFAVGQTVTMGIVSALARTQVGISDYGFFIQTDAAINPGNSGGALIDTNSRLVGINSAIFSQTGGNIGIGFAIPANMVKVVVAAAKTGGHEIRRPWFGATLQNVTRDIADSLGLDRPSGALVVNVMEKSPAAEAGLKRSDIIVAVDGLPIDDPEGFGYRFATKALGGTTPISVLRDGKPLAMSVRLAPAPEVPARDEIKVDNRSPFAGATIDNMSPAVDEEIGVDGALRGVVIGDVEDGSVAAETGLKKGDVILSVNDEKIATTRDLEKATAQRHTFWRLVIRRGEDVIQTVIGG